MKKYRENIAFNIVGYIYTSIIAFVCLLPFWMMVAASFTNNQTLYRFGYGLIPRDFSLKAYEIIFASPGLIGKSYLITVSLTIIGSAIGLFFMAMAAYALNRKDMKYRNIIALYLYFTTIFGGGLIPWYILMVRYLQLEDSYFAMLLPGLMGAWSILVLRSYMKTIPDSITEAARIDGANDFLIFFRLVIPLSTAGLAVIGMSLGLGYWNNWFNAMLFIHNQNLYPLQYLLYKILNTTQSLSLAIQMGLNVSPYQMPTETIKMATAVVATGPIILLYPLLQRYFVKGIMIGSLKG